MPYADSFCAAFLKSYLACRNDYGGDRLRWREVISDPYQWSSCMLWAAPPAPQCRTVLGLTAEAMGLRDWGHEPFSLDAVFLPHDAQTRGRYPFPIIVAIEHENDIRGFGSEIAKLVHIRCPLKVGITYAWPYRDVDRCRKRIEDDARAVAKVVGAHTSECVHAEYLYLLGVDERSDGDLAWHALAFDAEAGVDSGQWRMLAAPLND